MATSSYRTTELTCDTCDHPPVIVRGNNNDARKEARRQGWIRLIDTPSRDVCPDCRPPRT